MTEIRDRLFDALNVLVPQCPPAEVQTVVDTIMTAIDDAVETHREDAPHIYKDGSTY